MTSSGSSSLKATLILAGVFAAGAVAGGAAATLLSGPDAHADDASAASGCRGRTPDELVDLFRSRLQLDADQLAELEPVLRRGWAEIAAIYEGQEPAIGPVRERAREAIRQVLRPDQLPRHDELTAELDRRRAERRRCRQDGIAAARRLEDTP